MIPPLSPRPDAHGCRFRVLRRSADPPPALLLYDGPQAPHPARVVRLDGTHRVDDALWEVHVPGVRPGDAYAWAVDETHPLTDPFALALTGAAPWRGIVADPPPPPRWERPAHDAADLVVYELHVRGFTRGAGGGAYADLAARAGYLADLGVTAIELLPVAEFDEREVAVPGLVNYWGYSPLAWAAPRRAYARDADDPIGEFRDMVRACHAAGLEVLVDVVFNHTAEMGGARPARHFRALDDALFYLHDADGAYVDVTGCGHTVRLQDPRVRGLVVDTLAWWREGLGVDGFRFDLATTLALDGDGRPRDDPPLLREIEADPRLAGARLIAEAWDAGGGHRVRDWPGGARWAVWNDAFRDDVRRAWLGGGTTAGVLARRLTGSSDLFGTPLRGVNYVTAHDGFTLRDAVSYARRHNEANGEGGRDGHAHEVSANFGTEGPSDDPAVAAARDRARRNLVACLLLAHGTPMLLMGDEMGRTQDGNNNAYCHDGPLTWLDWSLRERDAGFHAFVRTLLALRARRPELRRAEHLVDGEVVWTGPDGGVPDWHEAAPFAYRIGGVCVGVNLGADACVFPLPGGPWRRVLDSGGGDGAAVPAGSLAVWENAPPPCPPNPPSSPPPTSSTSPRAPAPRTRS